MFPNTFSWYYMSLWYSVVWAVLGYSFGLRFFTGSASHKCVAWNGGNLVKNIRWLRVCFFTGFVIYLVLETLVLSLLSGGSFIKMSWWYHQSQRLFIQLYISLRTSLPDSIVKWSPEYSYRDYVRNYLHFQYIAYQRSHHGGSTYVNSTHWSCSLMGESYVTVWASF